MHSTDDLEDGYIGSGKRLKYSINKYGKENHQFEILEFLSSREELKKREKEIINGEMLANPKCINLTMGGGDGWDFVNDNDELKLLANIKSQEKQRELRENNPDWVENKRKKLSETGKMSYENGRIKPGWSKEATKKANSEEAREKRKRTFQLKGHMRGDKNHQYGKNFIILNKDSIVKRINVEEKQTIDKLLLDGWQKGFTTKQPKPEISNYQLKLKEERNLLKQSILETEIDFTLPKWQEKIGKILNKSKGSIKQFVKCHMPEIWEICYIDVKMRRN